MHKIDGNAILAAIKANNAKLDSCKDHHFVINDESTHSFNTYICTNCQGTVETTCKLWYEKGRRHAAMLVARQP